MPKTFFQFKQFTVHHGRCAMKVGTDGVLIGAWANVTGASAILDVGTGCGLIALMIAQRTADAFITGVEIEENAYRQAMENVENSRWKNRIDIVHENFRYFALYTKKRFDVIVSNPPFFSKSLKPANNSRMLARHDDNLSLKELIHFSSMLLKETGLLSVIVPYENKEKLNLETLTGKLFCSRRTIVKSKPGGTPKRILAEFTKNPAPMEESEFFVYSSDGNYSDEYKKLTQEFYLSTK